MAEGDFIAAELSPTDMARLEAFRAQHDRCFTTYPHVMSVGDLIAYLSELPKETLVVSDDPVVPGVAPLFFTRNETPDSLTFLYVATASHNGIGETVTKAATKRNLTDPQVETD